MHPSIVNTSSEMAISSPAFVSAHSNPHLVASNYYHRHQSTPNKTSDSNNTHYSYTNPSASTSSLNYMDLLRTWNYHHFLASSSPLKTDQLSDNSPSDHHHARNSSFHQYSPRLLERHPSQQTDDDYILGKFHHDTLVNLDSGETKNIQQLTTNDFLTSAKQSRQYSR